MARVTLSVVLLLSVLGFAQSSAPAALAQCSLSPGSVVELSGTPHLFINDNVGALLHWGGDTRALAGRTIAWSNTCTVGLPQLEQTVRGDPWLSAGLPQVGEVIYQAKWEEDAAEPTLLRIRYIEDVELFGINNDNYGTFVLPRSSWEPQYGFQVGNLQVGPLAAASSYAWSVTDQEAYAELLINMQGVESAALFQATGAGIDAGTSLPLLAECEEMGLTQFDQTRTASTSLAATQDCISRLALGPVPTPPSAPTNLVLSAGAVPNAVQLDWVDTSVNESGFRILRNGQTIATLPAQSVTYTDMAAPPGDVCYSVVAFNNGGEAQSPAECVLALTGVPAPPINLRVSPGQGTSLRLDWTDTSIDEVGFRIQRGDQTIATVGPNVTTYTDVTANPAATNCYRVVAFNGVGVAASDLACSAAVTAPTATAPTAPTPPPSTAVPTPVVPTPRPSPVPTLLPTPL